MILREIEVEGYKPFETVRLALDTNGIVFVVGPNNAGKSALLSAFDVIAGRGGGSPTDRNVHARKARIRATFEMSERWRTAFYTAIRGAHPDQEFLDAPLLRFLCWTFEQTDGTGPFIATSVDVSDRNRTWANLIHRRDTSTRAPVVMPVLDAWTSDVPWFGFPSELAMADLEPSSAPLDGVHDAFGLAFRLMNEALAGWRERMFHFRALRQGTDRKRAANAAPMLQPNGENLAEALLWVKTNDDALWKEITEVIDELIPEVGTLMVPTSGQDVSVVFRDRSGHMHNLKDLGTGVEQLLLTTYAGVAHPPGGLVIVEEPETNLHPGAQRSLMGFFRQWAEHRQMLVATHSAVFLDRGAGHANAVWLVQKSGRSSTVRELAGANSEVLGSLGIRLSDVLGTQGIIIVENESDARILDVWFGRELRSAHVSVVVSRGADVAHWIDELANWLAQANALTPRTLFLRDRDELRDDEIEKLTRHGVRVLARREIENYLLDPAAVASALGTRSGRSTPYDERAVAIQLREAADRLIGPVIVKRVARLLGASRTLPRADVDEIVKRGGTMDLMRARLDATSESFARLPDVWQAQEREVRARWDDEWVSLAPGADILTSVWHTHGFSYDKQRDGVTVARYIVPPEELRAVIEHIVTP